MSKDEYLQWAQAVVAVSSDPKEAEAFARRLEPHDKEAAARLRKVNSAADELVSHLASVVSAQQKRG